MKFDIKISPRQVLLLLYDVLSLYIVATIAETSDINTIKYTFSICMIVTYVFVLPSKLLNPKNIVFFSIWLGMYWLRF